MPDPCLKKNIRCPVNEKKGIEEDSIPADSLID
jgi:hypothetical protein